jgi:hypothetical protein
MNPDLETQGMVRSAALIADRVFEIEANVLRDSLATMDDFKEATILVEDFMDLMNEIDEEVGMVHEVGYMMGHLEVIASYLEGMKEDFAAVEDLKVGDAVSWKTAEQNPRGRIREIVRNGGKTVPGTSFVLQGTPEDPGYIIEIYEKKEGKWEATGNYVGRKADSILKNIELWRQAYSSEAYDFSKLLAMAKVLGRTEEEFLSSGYAFAKDDGEDKSLPLQFAKGYTVYRYEGSISDNTRDFCSEMVDLNRFYTYAEIASLGSVAVNPGFGLGGASTYSIFKYKGGPNCKHRWQKYYISENGTRSNKGPAPGIAGEKPYDMPNRGYAMSKMMFQNEDEQILVGPVMLPDIEIIRRVEKGPDKGKPYWVRFSKETIARIAEKFMRENRNHGTNVGHNAGEYAGTYIMESWLVENEQDKANTVYNLDVPVGSWVIKARVTDPNVWKQVKAGKLNGWSVEGSFMEKSDYEQYKKDRELYDRVIKILKSV